MSIMSSMRPKTEGDQERMAVAVIGSICAAAWFIFPTVAYLLGRWSS